MKSRLITYLENLEIREKSGNIKLVRVKSKKMYKGKEKSENVRELGKGRKSQGKVGFYKL